MTPSTVTELPTANLDASRSPSLILSVFPGIDLLGRAFEENGACVVRGPDLVWGGDIRAFFPPANVFEGVIGGSPCQDFSRARRDPPTGEGLAMLAEFVRVVGLARPAWWLLENVPGVPDVAADGYAVQRFFLNARECGSKQRRHRRFQFGALDGVLLVIPPSSPVSAESSRTCMATEGSKRDRRTFADFCELQGLPRTFSLPGLGRRASYRAVGNGVPIQMGRVLAIAIARRHVTASVRVCLCGCGREISSNARSFSAACRKRLERSRRDGPSLSSHRTVTVTVPA